MDCREKHIITEDNIQIYYRHYGGDCLDDKPVIICLPGLTRNSKAFHNYAVHLKEKFKIPVICPDMRGRGQSSCDDISVNYNLFREVQDIIQILTHEKINNIVIIGTSRGGMQATILAKLLINSVKSVILNDIGVLIPLSALRRLKGLFAMNTNFVGDYQMALQAFYKSDNGMTQNLTPEQEHEIVHNLFKFQQGQYYLDYDYRGLGIAHQITLEQMEMVNPEYCDLKPLFASLIDIPTLLLHGENSDILTDYCVHETKNLLPHIEYQKFSNRGHVLYFNEPEVIQTCNNFLAKFL